MNQAELAFAMRAELLSGTGRVGLQANVEAIIHGV
jgi:hypothetical protein